MHREDQVEEHDSFAQVAISRPTCNPGITLYGSSAWHRSYVTLRITRSKKIRNLNNTWYLPTESLIELNLTANQFAQLVAGMGDSSGVPATIRKIGNKYAEPCPQEHERQRFVDEFRQDMRDVVSKLDQDMEHIKELMKKPTLSKADREVIMNAYGSVRQQLGENTPYVAECFDEFMEHSETEAINEFESHIGSKLQSMGLDQLRGALELQFGKQHTELLDEGSNQE